MKIDLHTHTLCSKDSCNTYERIIVAVQRARLDGIAVTDHNELRGALELQRIAPFTVIPAEEIKTSAGEIIGLFLKDWIPPGLAPGDTVDLIHGQGGIVYVPHPFDEIRGSRLARSALAEITRSVDVLEVFNARNAVPRFNHRALEYATAHDLLAGAGSDAHTYGEYGHAYVDVPAFDGPEQFLDSMRRGRWHGHLSAPSVHAWSTINKTRKRLGLAAS